MSEFEKAVRHALIDRNMTMTNLADQIGYSTSYIYEIITGTRKSEAVKAKIKTFLDIDEDGK